MQLDALDVLCGWRREMEQRVWDNRLAMRYTHSSYATLSVVMQTDFQLAISAKRAWDRDMAAKIYDLSISEHLAEQMRHYVARTGRYDGFDVIRDILHTFGARRFRELPAQQQAECVEKITKIFEGRL